MPNAAFKVKSTILQKYIWMLRLIWGRQIPTILVGYHPGLNIYSIKTEIEHVSICKVIGYAQAGQLQITFTQLLISICEASTNKLQL